MIQENIFDTSISFTTRIRAEKFRRRQSHPNKRTQVYLNTLAVSAVNSCLTVAGLRVDLASSDSWNPILQTMLDVADLNLPDFGKIECRAVLPDEDWGMIPPEARSNRIAYVIVRLNEFLTEARILGFVREVNDDGKVLLSSLEPASDLLPYLNQHEIEEQGRLTHLSPWLAGDIENSWVSPQAARLPSIFPNYRSFRDRPIVETTDLAENLSPGACRVKTIKFGNPDDCNIDLILNIEPTATSEFAISVKICPAAREDYLPQGLELVVFDELKKPVMCAQANDTETIEFCFSGELGEHFGVEVSLNDYIKVETFKI